MARSRRPNTNVYRQTDPSVLRQLGQPQNAAITAIALDPDDALWVFVYFDQPIYIKSGASTVPEWFIGDVSFGGGMEFDSSGRVLHLKMGGEIEVGQVYDFEATLPTDGFQPVNGGNIARATGYVQAALAPDQFQIVSIDAHGSNNYDITFDAPIAPILIDGSGPDQLDWTGWDFDGNVVDHLVSKISGNNAVRVYMTSAVTSAIAWSVAADTNTFISIRGATLAPASGVTT